MIPDRLKPGDEVRVIAPARSASDIDERVLDRAKAALESLGLTVTFSKNTFSQSQRGCPTDDEKVEDLHEAFMDENVKCILAAIGGFNSNQLLGKINWQFIKDNPKIFGGFSDITVLNHAILAKTGLVTYACRISIVLVCRQKPIIRWSIFGGVCLQISRQNLSFSNRKYFMIFRGIMTKLRRAKLWKIMGRESCRVGRLKA